MTARPLSLLLAFTLILALAAGCSPGATQLAAPDSVVITEPAEEPASGEPAETDSDELAPPTALALSTDGERTALAAAQGDESRTWASGDSVNGTPVAGEPFLVGYGILLHDGTTQYQVNVFGDEPGGAFGKSAEPRYIEAQFADFNPTTAPASAQQTAAMEAAKTEIAPINPNATQGGVEFYIFFYPPLDEVQYPSVSLYSSPGEASSPQAIGGVYGWR
ncbi:MAG: hypothetical protein ACYC2X_09430 [Coriobacteriia bacterium]